VLYLLYTVEAGTYYKWSPCQASTEKLLFIMLTAVFG